jgi:hypothetical protein
VLKSFRIVGWSISFPVPQPGESLDDLPSAGEFEEAFVVIHQLAQELTFKVKIVEAPHYRRFVVQQRSRARGGPSGLVVFPLLITVFLAYCRLMKSGLHSLFPARVKFTPAKDCVFLREMSGR